MVVNALAVGCGLNVAPAQAHKFASNYHCFMVRRFDRTNAGRRLHFASAMTLTRHQDGEDASTGVSYLELADVLIRLERRLILTLRNSGPGLFLIFLFLIPMTIYVIMDIS